MIIDKNNKYIEKKQEERIDQPTEKSLVNLRESVLGQTTDFESSGALEIDFTIDENIFEISHEIKEFIHFICDNIVGREEVVNQAFYAFLTGEHQLLLGKTGMAKSLLARQIFECFHDISIFEKHLTKDTTPDNIFGAYDMAEMKRGKMIHNIEGSIVTADFAFLDEIFDANDMLLRSLLSLLNERKLINGAQIVDSPLNTVIAVSNYIRASETLEAVLDRFIYKSYIPENKNLYYQFSIDQVYGENVGNIRSPQHKLCLEKLRKIKNVIKTEAIKMPEYILFLKNYILRQYSEEMRKKEGMEKFTISDRTSAKVQDLLRASAVLDGRNVVEEKDLDNLFYLICMVGNKEEKTRLQGIIDTAKNYFYKDKELLGRVFTIMNIFRQFKITLAEKPLIEDEELILVISKIEQSFLGSGLNHRLTNFINKLGDCTDRSRFMCLLDLFQECCILFKDMATRKEAFEMISGFEYDVDLFYQIYMRSQEGYKVNFSDKIM